MAGADELLAAGDLEGVRTALVAAVKARPDDAGARNFLFQVLALNGEWDKATTQVKSLASLDPEMQMNAVVVSQLVEAERHRASAFAGQGAFPVLASTGPWTDQLAEALGAYARGDAAAGDAARDAAFDAAEDTPGDCDGVAFDWIADADPRFGPSFEAIVGGRWGIVPFAAVTSITSEGPQDLRDLIWLPVQIALRSGQSAAGFLPARYPGSETADADLRLGRRTDWRASPAGETGLGQKVWTLGGDSDVGLLDFRNLTFS